jgi:hypothetical protein
MIWSTHSGFLSRTRELVTRFLTLYVLGDLYGISSNRWMIMYIMYTFFISRWSTIIPSFFSQIMSDIIVILKAFLCNCCDLATQIDYYY